MTPPTEILTNNPTHPCRFCAEPVSIRQEYCNDACKNQDDIIKTFLNTTEQLENYEAAFNPHAI